MDFVRTRKKETQLVLVPESDNVRDRNAILVYRADDPDDDLGCMDMLYTLLLCPVIP